jgi:hypothetical protein
MRVFWVRVLVFAWWWDGDDAERSPVDCARVRRRAAALHVAARLARHWVGFDGLILGAFVSSINRGGVDVR